MCYHFLSRRDDADTEPVPATIRHTTAAAGRQHLRLIETSANLRQRTSIVRSPLRPRGIGKTVLLDCYAAIAIERDQPAGGHVPLPTDGEVNAESDQLPRP